MIMAIVFVTTTVFPAGYAVSEDLPLPDPGALVGLSRAYIPILPKGIRIYTEQPLRFDFIIDSGNSVSDQEEIKIESDRLVNYFLAALTIPTEDLWVNLSPYEKNRIIPEELAKTELGRDLLKQDYLLKQLTATLMYPEEELGNVFWDKIHSRMPRQAQSTGISPENFHKVWILPDSASVYEANGSVYVTEARLKVMLDSDYQAIHHPQRNSGTNVGDDDTRTEITKAVLLPAIEREVNEGENFAPLRQIYYALILAKWYREMIKESYLSHIYVDQKKIGGIDSVDQALKDDIYERYMKAYQRGVFNYIREDYDRLSHSVIPRRYFSGGFQDADIDIARSDQAHLADPAVGAAYVLRVDITPHVSQMDGLPLDNGRDDNIAKNSLNISDLDIS
ncbi:MAG: hypothetical protein K8I00_03650, partial [Candidatus Omnitrophica bacterium]|nr:hypothetical protein [Candidatus Omnitrophota bacterium]